ncbi:MAG: hypothetical protein ABSD27_06650 [Bryobacteraceae bacterium]|jgi:hypothetical protein
MESEATVLDWFRRLRAIRLTPLQGAPKVRRLKTYSAESGYVYQYFYKGYHASHAAGEPAAEHLFEVSTDRRSYSPVSVYLSRQAVESWQAKHARQLSATECYAAVKMGLFQALDERSGPDAMRQPVHLRPADFELIAETLGLE